MRSIGVPNELELQEAFDRCYYYWNLTPLHPLPHMKNCKHLVMKWTSCKHPIERCFLFNINRSLGSRGLPTSTLIGKLELLPCACNEKELHDATFLFSTLLLHVASMLAIKERTHKDESNPHLHEGVLSIPTSF